MLIQVTSKHTKSSKLRVVTEGIPKVDVTVDFATQEWYKKVTHVATSISQLEERALVGASMSMLWVPKNPLGVPVYGYQGRLGYSLLNVLDPKAGGAMVEAVQADGKPTWLDQIRYRFLHPTDESFAAYANVVLGEDGEDNADDATDPIREEVIVLSSGGSDRSFEGLTSHSPRVGLAQRVVHEPVNEPVGVDVEVPVETVDQLETRRKTKADKPEGKEKRAEGTATATPRKRPSILPDDSATLTDIMKKKALEDKKKKLDEQTAAMLASKKARLHKEAPPAPSDSKIDMGVFTAKHGNLLEQIFEASGSRGAKPGKSSRKVDISKITPPISPPSRTLDLYPPRDNLGEKGKQNVVHVEHVNEGGADGAGGAGGHGVGGAGGDG
ncbi:hypothetical protein Hdeb2414_s0021g00579381 [Helianthus debilis subsp. tardiflorus]